MHDCCVLYKWLQYLPRCAENRKTRRIKICQVYNGLPHAPSKEHPTPTSVAFLGLTVLAPDTLHRCHKSIVDPWQELRCICIPSKRVTVFPHLLQRATGGALWVFVRYKCLLRSFLHENVTALPVRCVHSSHLKRLDFGLTWVVFFSRVSTQYAVLRAVIRFVPALTSVNIFCALLPDATVLGSYDGSFNWGECRASPLTATPGV